MRDLACHFLPVAEPDEEARVSRLAVASDEVKIIVESGECCANIILDKVRGSWCQKMCCEFHFLGECVSRQSKAYCTHLSSDLTTVDHVAAPSIHLFSPSCVTFRHVLWNLIFNFLRALSQRPEISPLGVELWREGRHRRFTLWDRLNEQRMVSGLLDRFRSNTCLIAELWEAIFELFTSVEPFADIFKIFFNHVDIFFIGLLLNARVFNEDDAEFVQRSSDFSALLLPAL